MDYPWYFPPNNGGGNNNNVMKTKTIMVSGKFLTTSAELANITKETFAYSVEAYELEFESDAYENIVEIENPVTISTVAEFKENNAIFTFSWETPFYGYININYWEKTE